MTHFLVIIINTNEKYDVFSFILSFFGYNKIVIASFAERLIFVFTVSKIYTILAKHFPLRFHCKLITQNPFFRLV